MCAATSIVLVTRRIVRERAVILAIVVGRSVQDVSKADGEQAKWELMGEPTQGLKRRMHALDAPCERWQSAPGHKVPVPSGDDDNHEEPAIGKSRQGLAE